MLVFAALAWVTHGGFIAVLDSKQGNYRLSAYSFAEEDSDHPRLRLLREREKLDQVVAPGKSQLQKIVLLRKWAHEQWKAGPVFYYPPFDAVEILDLARKHRNYGFCAQYAIVFVQACRSLGLHTRYVDTIEHFTAAVWSDEFNRWILMDPSNDVHYERDGVPLRGRDMYQAYWKKDVRGIDRVGSDGSRTPITVDDAKVYANYSILLRNDQLSHPGLVLVNGKQRPLVHMDDFRKYPLMGRDTVGYGDRFLAWHAEGNKDKWDSTRYRTSNPDDLREVFNQTIINVAGRVPERSLVKIKLIAESVPDLEGFIIRMDDHVEQTPLPAILLTIGPGVHKFRAQVKTKSGWVGGESWVRLLYVPGWRFPWEAKARA